MKFWENLDSCIWIRKMACSILCATFIECNDKCSPFKELGLSLYSKSSNCCKMFLEIPFPTLVPFQNWSLPIYRHNFTHRDCPLFCWSVKTEIISKIVGFAHVVFIGTPHSELLFSLFLRGDLSPLNTNTIWSWTLTKWDGHGRIGPIKIFIFT